MSDLISRQAAIELIRTLYPSAPIMRMNRKRWEEKYEPYIEAEKALEKLPSVHPDKDLIHLQKEQAYLQGYEDGRKMIRCKDCMYSLMED